MPAQKRVRRTLTGTDLSEKGMTPKEIRDIVRKEMSDELEEKKAITEYSNIFLNAAIPSGVVFNGQGNYFKLLPQILQSTVGGAGNAYNERVGNEINLKEIDIHGYLTYANVNMAVANQKNAKLAVRVMILRARDINDVALAFDNMPTDDLIEFGDPTGGAGGPVPYVGNTLDSFRDINRNTFAVRYDQVHYLTAPVTTAGVSSVDLSNVPSTLKILRHKLKFGDKGLKLKFKDASDTTPENFPYFMAIGYSSMYTSDVPDDQIVKCTFNMTSKFTDA